ncbi:MAG TPA: 50S ribosomal protein L21 [Candidatus Nitrosotalea sp.]|nr:50S ribosomal protein L21 [Candidatus Nitrosotalea sp.]
MSTPSAALTAVVVSGGKQYRVASGDRILVDRLAAAPGSEISLGPVLMLASPDSIRVGAELADTLIQARVISHSRGPKIDVLRYKSKKRVRVHRGARADLSAIEILSLGDSAPAPSRRPARRTLKAAESEPAPVEEAGDGA